MSKVSKVSEKIVVESGSQRSASFYVNAPVNKCMVWVKTNKKLFLMVLLLVLIALIPLYGILFPPLADLPEHLLTSKLLWEKLSGVSHLDLEISWFLSYRLFSSLMVIFITFFKLWGIPLVYLPKVVAMSLISIHAVIVSTIHYFGLQNKSWKSFILAVCLSVPAVVCMYSACYFIGFVGFTLGITLLIPAVFLTERFLRSGKLIDASLVFLTLLIVYMAHPFALAFWLMWCFSRMLAALVTRTLVLEWKKIVSLGVIILPIFLYHFLATAGTEMTLSSRSFTGQSPFITLSYWYEHRLGGLLDGTLLKADDAADSKLFGPAAIGLILSSTFLAFFSTRSQRAKNFMLSGIFLIFISSWVNEKFIPTPGVHWLAYDYRFVSTVYSISLALSGMVLIRFLPVSTDKLQYKIIFVLLAFFSVLASANHLFEVRKAYTKFDVEARKYMAKIFIYENPTEIHLPHSRWHPDGTFLKHYICLEQADCDPEGTGFRSYGGDLYPVKLKSGNRASVNFNTQKSSSPQTAIDENVLPVTAFNGGQGNGRGQFSKPRGITVDSKGNFYVADTGNGRVQKFNADGTFVSAFATPGEGARELKVPNGVAVDAADNIYVVDASNSKLMKFDPEGRFAKEWKGPDAGFYGPRDIAIGPNKDLYILDQGKARIVRFNPETEKFAEWGRAGEGNGEFKEPTGITIGGDHVYVTDAGNNRIQVFDLDGNFIRQWEVPEWDKYLWHYPDAAFDAQAKRLYVTSGWTNEVLVFDENGNRLDSLKPASPEKLDNPSSLVIAELRKEKLLYILNTGSARITRLELGKAEQKK